MHEKLYELLRSNVCECPNCAGCQYCDDDDGCVSYMEHRMADHLIANDVTIVRHGRWIITQRYEDIIDMDVVKFTCSVCGEYRLTASGLNQATNYCPNCGARMDGESE